VAKILLMSILIMTVVAPLIASKDPHPARGVKKMVRWMIIFDLIWVLSLVFLYARLL
jgi:hypothetical protein